MFFKTILGSFKIILGYFRPFKIILDQFKAFQGGSVFSERRPPSNRPIRLTQCCTQFRSVRVKVLCVFYLHDNIAFTFKRYGTEYLEQNVLFRKDLNWVQHWVSRIGLFIYVRLYTHCVPTFELTNYGEIGLFQDIDMCNSNKLHTVWLIMWPTCKCIHGVAKSHQPICFGLRSSFWNHVIVDKPVCALEDVDTEDTK